jgi:hypothetical protein
MGRHKGKAQHKYTPEQIEFIRENIKNMTWKELTTKFNEIYGTNLSYKALAATGKRYKIQTGRTGQFPKGLTPWNKGMKGLSFPGMEATQFKKGNKPANWRPLGSERVSKDGYIEVKVADGRLNKNWKAKHILLWEEQNGPVPPGYAIVFGDGNNRNFDPANLLLVSRAQLARMNQRGLIQDDAELTKTGILIADVYNKIGERKRKNAKRQHI